MNKVMKNCTKPFGYHAFFLKYSNNIYEDELFITTV